MADGEELNYRDQTRNVAPTMDWNGLPVVPGRARHTDDPEPRTVEAEGDTDDNENEVAAGDTNQGVLPSDGGIGAAENSLLSRLLGCCRQREVSDAQEDEIATLDRAPANDPDMDVESASAPGNPNDGVNQDQGANATDDVGEKGQNEDMLLDAHDKEGTSTPHQCTTKKKNLFGGDLVVLVAVGIVFTILRVVVYPPCGFLFPVFQTTKITTAGNRFQGSSIPKCLGELTALRYLYLYNNDLTGTIPPQLGQLAALRYLVLHSNDLTGTIPSQLGQLAALMSLSLDNNYLTGTIPSQLGQLTALTYLNLNSNDLTGTIPSQLGQLTALDYLSLYNNDLTGTIPSQLGQLTALDYLNLNSNDLTGTIPSQLGQLTALNYLSLYNNDLTGTIPSQLAQLTALLWLDLRNNDLTGTVPSFVADISTASGLSGNNFTSR